MTVKPAIAFLGLGAMGSRMARNLAEGGYPLTVWNRTRGKTTTLESGTIRIAHAADRAVEQADVVITMLTSGEAVSEVLFEGGVAESIPEGATLIDMSSIPPAFAREHARKLMSSHVHYLDAPVSGGTRGASDGSLAILVGGDFDTFERNRPILKTMGNPTHVGAVGAGQSAKLANQVIVAVTIAALCEGLALAAELNVDKGALLQSLRGGFADSRILREHGERIERLDFSPGARIEIHVKDLETAISEMRGQSRHRMPISELVLSEYRELVAVGYGDLDHSALWLRYTHKKRARG